MQYISCVTGVAAETVGKTTLVSDNCHNKSNVRSGQTQHLCHMMAVLAAQYSIYMMIQLNGKSLLS